jgi:hypothetical protein
VRVEMIEVSGLEKPVPKTRFEGPAEKSVDEILAAKRQIGPQRVPQTQVQDLVLRELAAGEKSRADLDATALDELGVNADSVYKSALEPLKRTGQIKPRKDGFNGGWHWSLTKSDDDWREVGSPTQVGYPSSVTKPKTGDSANSSIFEDGYPSTSGADPPRGLFDDAEPDLEDEHGRHLEHANTGDR